LYCSTYLIDRLHTLPTRRSSDLGVVLDWVKVGCDIAAVLSIFLAWVPILGQVLLVLAAIGAIIAIVDAAIKFANGEGSFGELLRSEEHTSEFQSREKIVGCIRP